MSRGRYFREVVGYDPHRPYHQVLLDGHLTPNTRGPKRGRLDDDWFVFFKRHGHNGHISSVSNPIFLERPFLANFRWRNDLVRYRRGNSPCACVSLKVKIVCRLAVRILRVRS